MPGDNYYLLTALPSLPELGSPLPLRLADLAAHLGDAPRVKELVDAILLSDDLLQRDSFLAGDTKDVEPAVLTVEQVRGDAPLPDYLTAEEGADSAGERRLLVDAVWAAYFRHVQTLAKQSDFLDAWLRSEVGVRNALAIARARALGLNAEDYLVAPDLGDDPETMASVVAEWSAAPDPLSAQRALDQWRWAWLNENDRWFSFTDDELVAYAAKLLLLDRWQRIGSAGR